MCVVHLASATSMLALSTVLALCMLALLLSGPSSLFTLTPVPRCSSPAVRRGFESDPARASAYAPYVLRLPGQWVLRKPPPEPQSAASGWREGEQPERRIKLIKRFEKRTNAVKPPLRCCLNGWADPLTVRCEASRDLRVHGNYTRKCTMPKPKPGEKFYTRCLPDRPMLQQDTCALPAGRTHCVSKFACRSAVIAG